MRGSHSLKIRLQVDCGAPASSAQIDFRAYPPEPGAGFNLAFGRCRW